MKTGNRADVGVGMGLLLESLGAMMWDGIGPFLYIVGSAVFIHGCGQYAMSKGHSRNWGAIGILGILALPILYFFPNRAPAEGVAESVARES